MSIETIISVARGERKADLVLRNARIVNVFSHEIHPGDVAIHDGAIVGIGHYTGEEEHDLEGRYLVPGFIDGHLHVESSMVGIPEFTRAVLPRGTTTLIIDPHEISNVMGLEGINYMLKSSKYNPMNVYLMLPSCVPATHLESAGAELKAIDLLPLLANKWVLGLGEMMNYPGVLCCDEDVLEKIKIAGNHLIDGHAPNLEGADLCAYIAAGMRSDHECTGVEEAAAKLRLGMHIMIREGSTPQNLADLLPLVTPENERFFFFVTDDRNPQELLIKGHIDSMIREAIARGIDPITAIRMATLNAATYFGLEKLGAIAPGYVADLVVLDDLREVSVDRVYKNGRLVAQAGKAIYPPPPKVTQPLRGSVNVRWLDPKDFQLAVRGPLCRVIGVVPGQILTRCLVMPPTTENGLVCADPRRDILKLAVIERHCGQQPVSMGLIHGFGLSRGALATTIGHDSHNMMVVGADDRDMFHAAVHLARIQGGIVLVVDQEVVECLPLPIAGLMSDQSIEFVREKMASLIDHAHRLGARPADPFMTLSFLALPVIPELKLTDRGLVDVNRFQFVDLFVEDSDDACAEGPQG
jgi:adenine deaminase